MRNLTKGSRASIEAFAIKAAFAARDRDLEDRRKKLAAMAYDMLFVGQERAAIDACPSHWLTENSYINVNVAGKRLQIGFGRGRPMPVHARKGESRMGYCDVTLGREHPHIDLFESYMNDVVALEEARKEAGAKLRSFLHQFRTVEQLLEAWPEGKDAVEHAYGGRDKASTALTVSRDDVNAVLGLSPVKVEDE